MFAELKRLGCLVLLMGALLAVVCEPAQARPQPQRQSNPRYAAIVIDAQSGQVLFESAADAQRFPASLTKMMTLFLVFEALERNQLDMNQQLKVSLRAAQQPPTKLGLRANQYVTVRDALMGLLTTSANDAAVVMAEKLGGSESNFAVLMTRKARKLGMNNTTFQNASGLPNSGQVTTARDMAILSRALMQYFPQHYHYFSTRGFNYKGVWRRNHNNLMLRYRGMDGLKTGYINASGFNLAASAVRNDRRLIGVVFGGRTAYSRDQHMASLLDRTFAQLGRGHQTTQFASVQPTPAPAYEKAAQPSTAGTALALKTQAPTPVSAAEQRALTQPAPAPQAQAPQAAYRPDGGAVRTLTVPASYQQPTAVAQQPVAQTQTAYAAPVSSNWGIQVGAFRDVATGQQALIQAKTQLASLLGGGQTALVVTDTAAGRIYRARILGLNSQAATQACQALRDCMVFATE